MNAILLALAAFASPVGLTVVMYALRNAPEGYEDAEGFHSRATSSSRSPSLCLRLFRLTKWGKHSGISLFPNYEI